MAFDAAIEQLRQVHAQATKDLELKVQSQEEELCTLRTQLIEARTESEDYKAKFLATKASLKRYAQKFEKWMADIKKAKQEKKRDGVSASHVVDLELTDSTDANLQTPPVAKATVERARDSAAIASAEKAHKKARISTEKATSITPAKLNATSDLAAEFPTDTPPDDVLAPVLALNAPLPRGSASIAPLPTAAPPAAAAGAAYKYVEVVRKKKDREQLPATDCDQCKQFLDAVTNGSTALDRSALVNMCSRHRARFERPSTPPGFWDLSFPQGGSKDDG